MRKLVGCYNKSVILTYVGVAVSLLGILFAERNDWAISCLIVAGVCDLFDGKVARMCKRTEQEKQFGIQIDSLADVVSFLIFPAVLLFSIGRKSWVTYPIAVLYVLAGITRLGWFNITTDGDVKYYHGLPVTYAALVITSVYAIWKILGFTFFPWILDAVYLLLALLFVLNIKIKKPTGVWYGIFALLAVAAIVVIVVM